MKTDPQDQFDAEGVGITNANRNWLRDYIVWPQPGSIWSSPDSPPPPGWVRVVSNYTEFADTICEKLKVVICRQPTADFSATPTSGNVPLTVNFTDLSTGATSWAWDFDNDGTTDSTDQNPTHQYAAAGKYTVKLTATNDCGSDDETKTAYITANPALSIATTSLDDGQGCVYYEVTLQASGGTPPYKWKKIAGKLPPRLKLSTKGVISGTPTTAGTFNFTVQVTDGAHPHATATQPLSIKVNLTTITVISPNNGSENWAIGSSQTITWTSTYPGGNVRIQLSRNGGKSWKTIIKSTPDDGSQDWEVKSKPTTQARIKVVCLCNKKIFDISDADFTIISSP
jgi:PKD repeat protein